MEAKIYDRESGEIVYVELTTLCWDGEKVVCPECGESLEWVGECGYETKGWSCLEEPQWHTTCWKYICPECGAEFYSKEEV